MRFFKEIAWLNLENDYHKHSYLDLTQRLYSLSVGDIVKS